MTQTTTQEDSKDSTEWRRHQENGEYVKSESLKVQLRRHGGYWSAIGYGYKEVAKLIGETIVFHVKNRWAPDAIKKNPFNSLSDKVTGQMILAHQDELKRHALFIAIAGVLMCLVGFYFAITGHIIQFAAWMFCGFCAGVIWIRTAVMIDYAGEEGKRRLVEAKKQAKKSTQGRAEEQPDREVSGDSD